VMRPAVHTLMMRGLNKSSYFLSWDFIEENRVV
jgi:hypothetical protein